MHFIYFKELISFFQYTVN